MGDVAKSLDEYGRHIVMPDEVDSSCRIPLETLQMPTTTKKEQFKIINSLSNDHRWQFLAVFTLQIKKLANSHVHVESRFLYQKPPDEDNHIHRPPTSLRNRVCFFQQNDTRYENQSSYLIHYALCLDAGQDWDQVKPVRVQHPRSGRSSTRPHHHNASIPAEVNNAINDINNIVEPMPLFPERSSSSSIQLIPRFPSGRLGDTR